MRIWMGVDYENMLEYAVYNLTGARQTYTHTQHTLEHCMMVSKDKGMRTTSHMQRNAER